MKDALGNNRGQLRRAIMKQAESERISSGHYGEASKKLVEALSEDKELNRKVDESVKYFQKEKGGYGIAGETRDAYDYDTDEQERKLAEKDLEYEEKMRMEDEQANLNAYYDEMVDMEEMARDNFLDK